MLHAWHEGFSKNVEKDRCSPKTIILARRLVKEWFPEATDHDVKWFKRNVQQAFPQWDVQAVQLNKNAVEKIFA